MKEKRGILGGEKNNMVKSQPKKEVNIDTIFSIIRLVCSSLFLITLIIWAIISKNYDFLMIILFAGLLSTTIVIFFWAYTKCISNK